MKTGKIILAAIILISSSCSEHTNQLDFKTFLNEPCMLVNYEQDNTIEGHYLTVHHINDSTITVSLPENFYVTNSNYTNWVIGWGENKPLYDAGVENLREISKTGLKNKTITLGSLLRGKGLPKQDQRIVFWNKYPSGFINHLGKPIIDTKIWPEFAGSSICFSSVKYDSVLSKWIMIVNECDTPKIQIYAALSSDLVHWDAANGGRPILKASDFKNCKWAGKDKTGSIAQTPFTSDMVRFNNKWFLFLDGYDSYGKRHIGLAVSGSTALGPYKIMDNPVLSPGKDNEWNNEAVFYAKVEKYKNGFIMFYDGRNKSGLERIGMATSNNLVSWHNANNNPVIDQHTGWRSFIGTTEPNYVEIRNDTILLLCAGVKKLKTGFWNHYITQRSYCDKSGNVGDAQLGFYISTDDGKTFSPHRNNPMFINNYYSPYEDDHMGGNFKLIKTDSMDYVIYQAKSGHESRYNILLRQRTKKEHFATGQSK